MEPMSLLMEEKWLPSMAAAHRATWKSARRAGRDSCRCSWRPMTNWQRLTGFELTRGALGAFRRPALCRTVADVLREARAA